MVSLELTDGQRELSDRYWRIARQEVMPRVEEIEKTRDVPMELRRILAEAGAYGRIQPKDVGGSDGTLTDLSIQEEALGYANHSVAATVLSSNLGGYPLAKRGTDAQQDRWLRPLIDGTQRMGFAITEPEHGSDASRLESSAQRDGASWVLNGSKAWIGQAGYADYFAVWVRTDPDAEPPHRGISTFVLERDTPGFRMDDVPDIMGYRAGQVGHFTFEDVRLDEQHLIGDPGEGWYHMMDVLNHGRVATAAICLGASQAALDHSKAYARERKQFGKPIADYQAIKMKIADMSVDVQTSRLLVYHAAKLIDEGHQADREANTAKLAVSEAQQRVADNAMRIHGGWGFEPANDVERIFRDARVMVVGEGTSDILRIQLAKREMALDEYQG